MRSRIIPLASPLARLLLAASLPIILSPGANGESLLSPIFRTLLGQRKPSEKVQVHFIGNQKLNAQTLRNAIEEQLSRIASDLKDPNASIPDASAEDAASYIGIFYQYNGFDDADVTAVVQHRTLELYIREGQKTSIGNISVLGNPSIETNRIASMLVSPTRDRATNTLPKRLPFVQDDLRMGRERVRDLYRSEGFVDADVDELEIERSPNGETVNIRLTVHEGPRHAFGEPRFSGSGSFPEALLRAAIAPILREPYTEARVTEIEQTLRNTLANSAFLESRVVVSAPVEAQSKDHVVPVSITIHTGAEYRFGPTTIEGLDRLNPEFISRRTALLKGQPYSKTALERVRKDLQSTGLFDSLRITPIPDASRSVTLQCDAVETRQRELGFSLGYGAYEGAILAVQAADRNIRGSGNAAEVELEFSQRGPTANISYTLPWIGASNYSLSNRFLIRQRNEIGYEKIETGLRAELQKKPARPFLFSLYGAIRNVEITGSTFATNHIGSSAYQIVTGGISAGVDQRDSRFNPRSGWLASTTAEVNTTSDGLAFTRLTARSAIHFRPTQNINVALGSRFGTITGSSEVPIDERFFLGGPYSVRSFTERQLTTHRDAGKSLGGNQFFALNAEADFPLFPKLRGAVFADAGNLSNSNQINWDETRYALGVGIRYDLVVGPLRVDVGKNPSPRKYDPWGAINVSFGFAF